MTYFVRNGNDFKITADGAVDISQVLEPGNYVVKMDVNGGLYLELIKTFDLPSKLYGDLVSVGKRILSTFEKRRHNTGVLLVGEKGSGKTLLAKWLSIEASKAKIPTILVNQGFNGEALGAFLSKIDQSTVVFFDEFEKNFPSNDSSDDGINYQEKLLTLLDGVYHSKKLFLLTCNNRHAIDQHLINRPGRIFYHKQFYGLEDSFVTEYVDDCLNSEIDIKFKNELLYRIRLIGTVNFDMLQAIVEEANRYPTDVSSVFEMLNVGMSDRQYYTMNLKPVGTHEFIEIHGGVHDPLHEKSIKATLNYVDADIKDKILKKREKAGLSSYFIFEHSDLTGVDKDGSMTFVNSDKDELLLKKQRPFSGGHMSVGYND